MGKTKIEWVRNPDGTRGETWNPVRGCAIVSEGCENCYAQLMAHRQSGPGKAYEGLTRLTGHGPKWTGEVRLVPEILGKPLRWRKPRGIFVNSMSDIFHKDIPASYIDAIFRVMREAERHRFMVLTKRAERLAEVDEQLREWPENVWMGVTVELDDYTDRIDLLRASRAAVKFLSMEPLLGPFPDLDLDGIDWVIVGGESGRRGARPMEADWAREIRDQCLEQGVAFFFKQWGAFGSDGVKRSTDDNGRELDGRIWDGYPIVEETTEEIQNRLF